MPKVSIVIPVYLAEDCIQELYNQIKEVMKNVTPDHEIIMVVDGSGDHSWDIIKQLGTGDPLLRGLRFTRNFGQHYAITAGLVESKGDYVIVMDCDLQDDPTHIPLLYQKALDGYDIVYTIKKTRKHSRVKNFFSLFFARLLNWLAEGSVTANPNIGAYSLISRRVVGAFCQFKDSHRHYLLLLQRLGYKSAFVEIVHHQRYSGKSAYGFKALTKLAIDGITSQSDKLLQLSISLGFLFFVFSISYAVYLVIMYFVHGFKEGWASTIVLILLSTGVILMCLGIMGLYIGKIFDQVKQRPLYIIDEKINM